MRKRGPAAGPAAAKGKAATASSRQRHAGLGASLWWLASAATAAALAGSVAWFGGTHPETDGPRLSSQRARPAFVPAPPPPPPGEVPPIPSGLRAAWDCAARCAAMTPDDRAAIEATLRQAGCDPKNPGAHVICSTTPEQICVGSCGGGQQDMSKFLPGAFGPSGPKPAELLPQLDTAYQSYWQCAEECVHSGALVDAFAADAEKQALAMLRRCGVVRIEGAFDHELLGEVQKAYDAILARRSAYRKLIDRKQLHDGRYQVYLPFREPFTDRRALGVSDMVLHVLEGYFGERGFGIDHATVLTSSSPSGNQSLHPDVPYFKGLTVSVHTALIDVTRDMGPTYFCPCTGESQGRGDWAGSAAIKMTILKEKACFGPSFAPALTRQGTITIYDGAMFHQGLDNGSGKDRPVLKVEVGAEGYPERRNYPQMAPPAGQKHVRFFRQSMGPPRMGAPLRQVPTELSE